MVSPAEVVSTAEVVLQSIRQFLTQHPLLCWAFDLFAILYAICEAWVHCSLKGTWDNRFPSILELRQSSFACLWVFYFFSFLLPGLFVPEIYGLLRLRQACPRKLTWGYFEMPEEVDNGNNSAPEEFELSTLPEGNLGTAALAVPPPALGPSGRPFDVYRSGPPQNRDPPPPYQRRANTSTEVNPET
ncbi:hypothetical protein G7054_g4573 [Neopestalotiopsis clavispora]|nr:hypothetical protein G7054_g4573 [Neopestalotiopsis clavispora]